MGVIRVTQSTASTNKVCYPFMQGKYTHIAFCPVWDRNKSTSFLPAGLRCIWKPDAGNACGAWDTIKNWNTCPSKNQDTHKQQQPNYSCQNDYVKQTWTYTSPYGFHLTHMSDGGQTQASTYAASSKNVPLYFGSWDRNAGKASAANPCVVYQVSSNTNGLFGIIPALRSDIMGNKKEATGVFGAILGIPMELSTYWDICTQWYSDKLSHAFDPTNGTTGTDIQSCYIGSSAWSALRHWVSDTWHTNRQEFNTAANNLKPAWPTDNTIFTGTKYIGSVGNAENGGKYLVFTQYTDTIKSGTIITPQFYSIYFHPGDGAPEEFFPTVYDQWIGIKT